MAVLAFPAYFVWWFLNHRGGEARLYSHKNVAAMGLTYLFYNTKHSYWFLVKLGVRFVEAVCIGSFHYVRKALFFVTMFLSLTMML